VATTQCRSRYFAFACCSFGFGFACCELYCLKVVELVLHLLVINYVVNLMMCVIFVLCVILVLYILPILEVPHPGRQPKQAVVKK
jgi:hypothetical protein